MDERATGGVTEFSRDGAGGIGGGLLRGELAFVSPEAQLQRSTELLGAGAMVVEVNRVDAGVRSRLGEHLDAAVELALEAHGAPAPGLMSWSEIASGRIADQLFRARSAGHTGIVLALGSLAGATRGGVLDPDDAAVLRDLARAAAEAPLVVMIDDADLGLAGHAAPLPLPMLLSGRPLRDAETIADAPVSEIRPSEVPSAEETVTDLSPVEDDDGVDIEVEVASTELGVPFAAAACDGGGFPIADRGALPDAPRELPPVFTSAPVAAILTATAAGDAARKLTAGVPAAGPGDAWRAWALALSAARGPQPLAAFERLFTENYVPLATAIDGGLEDPRAVRAHDEFRRAFERAYADAFVTFGATGRRPRMVMDVFDFAVKQARLHNARSTHVLVVDSLRWDLGAIVRDAIARDGARSPTTVASLTAESILWSALPSTTMRQLETIARGQEALRSAATDEPSESLRGRTAEVVRRLRVGPREIYKLDLVPSMLAHLDENEGALAASLDEIGEAVAEVLLRHLAALAPRTLLVVCGDHGFTADRRGRILHGGASPEEVLVPAHAWLAGELH